MELTGVPAAAVLTAPLVLLLVIAVIQLLDRRGRKPRSAGSEIATGRYGAPVPRERPAASSPAAGLARDAESDRRPARRSDDLSEAVAGAEKAGDEARLAGLSIELARLFDAEGRTIDAGEMLRKSIRIAARLGLKETHAAARLALGDLSRQCGDLTTACEHWQLARGLYAELGKAAELEAAETRMRNSGCPTDWVLNDF